MGLNESKREYIIKKLEILKDEILSNKKSINDEIDDHIRIINSHIESLEDKKEKKYMYSINYDRKSHRYYFTVTRDGKEFATEDMTYDEACKIIEDNDLKCATNSPKIILELAASIYFYSCAELTGTIKEPIFFETSTR